MVKKSFYIAGFSLIILISFWGIAYNQGTVTVNGPDSLFTVSVDNKTIECTKSCQIKLSPKSYDVVINKAGYSSLTQKIFLIRGEKESIEYSPIFIPEFEKVPRIVESENYRFLNQENQLFQISDTDNTQFKTVSTFRAAISSAMASVSDDLKHAFIWSDETVTDYYLVDTVKESRKKLNIDNSNFEFKKPTNFKMLNNNLVLIEVENSVYLFYIEANRLLRFPVNKTEHVTSLDEEHLLVISGRSLDTRNASNDISSITSLLNQSEEDQLSLDLQLKADKLYRYNFIDGNYEFLTNLPEAIEEPFSLSNKSEVNLTTQEESFVIRLSEN